MVELPLIQNLLLAQTVQSLQGLRVLNCPSKNVCLAIFHRRSSKHVEQGYILCPQSQQSLDRFHDLSRTSCGVFVDAID